jgi:hypothetical protein
VSKKAKQRKQTNNKTKKNKTKQKGEGGKGILTSKSPSARAEIPNVPQKPVLKSSIFA